MQVKYKGERPVIMPTLGKSVKPGDVIEVPDGFEHPQFEVVKAKVQRGGDVDATAK